MPDTHVNDDTKGPGAPPNNTRRYSNGRRYGGGGYSAGWKALVAATADYEPDDDGDLLTWMAGEIRGITDYGEAVISVYETCVTGLGVDPAGLQALHDVADAVTEAASRMSATRRKFADHYAEVREFAQNGGVLAYNGRWHTGEGDD